MTRAALLGALALASLALARPPTASDRFWAEWDGVDVEAWLAVQELGETVTRLQAEGSLARRSTEGDGEAWLRTQVGDALVDSAATITSTGRPIRMMVELAQQRPLAWLDWGFRARVNTLYREYRQGLRETGDPQQGLERAQAALTALLATKVTAPDQAMLQVVSASRGLILAQLLKTDLELHPEDYPEDSPVRVKPGALPAAVRALPQARRRALLDCLCRCGSNANQAAVAVRWNPEPDPHTHACATPAEGPCVNKGYGCWRTTPARAGACAQECARGAGLGQVPTLGN